MDRGDNLCTLPHGRGDTFCRPSSDVADGEDAWAIRLQRMYPFDARPDEAAFITSDITWPKPIGIRIGSDENEKVAKRRPPDGST